MMYTLRFRSILSLFKNREGKKLYYPRLVKRGKPANEEEVAELLSTMSSVSKGDIYSVLRNLSWALKILLMDGRSVKLKGLGTFNVTLQSKYGVENEKDVSAKQIKSLHIHLIPEGVRTPMDGLTRSMFSGVRFERIDSAGNITNDNSRDNYDSE